MDMRSGFFDALSATEAGYAQISGSREAKSAPLDRGDLFAANDRRDVAKRLERLQVDPGTVRATFALKAAV